MSLAEDAKFRLYEELRAAKLELVAMLHTHPEAWVGLSPTDQANGLSTRVGFWSLVLPCFARGPVAVGGIGMHVKCDEGWRHLTSSEAAVSLVITDA